MNFHRALGFESSRVEMAEIIDTLDPENEGIVMWDGFIRLCALKMKCTNFLNKSMKSRTTLIDGPIDRDEQAELESAYKLFTNNTDGPITIFDLKRIARELKENVTDEQLTDMLMEASGGMTVNL